MIAQPFVLEMIYFTVEFNTEWKFHVAAISLIYASTAIFSARQHVLLSRGKDNHIIKRLILGTGLAPFSGALNWD